MATENKDTNNLGAALELLRTISTPLRLHILLLLRAKGPQNLGQIVVGLSHLNATSTNVIGHLKHLVGRDLVKSEEQGRNVVYELKGDSVERLAGVLQDLARTATSRFTSPKNQK